MNDLVLPGDVDVRLFGAVIAALWSIGAILKHGIPSLENRWIPLILLPLGVVAVLSLASEVNPKVVVLAVSAVAIAIGGHQIATKPTNLNL